MDILVRGNIMLEQVMNAASKKVEVCRVNPVTGVQEETHKAESD